MNLKSHNVHVENKLIKYAVKSFNHAKGNNPKVHVTVTIILTSFIPKSRRG